MTCVCVCERDSKWLRDIACGETSTPKEERASNTSAGVGVYVTCMKSGNAETKLRSPAGQVVRVLCVCVRARVCMYVGHWRACVYVCVHVCMWSVC